MVAERKVYWAPVSNLEKRAYSVEKITCGYIAGPNDGTHDATRDQFCSYPSQHATDAVAGIEDIARNKVCVEGVTCNPVFAAAAVEANNVMYKYVNNFCRDACDQVSGACQVLYRGYGTITFEDGSSGTIGGRYFDPSEATSCHGGYTCEETQ